MGICLSHTKYTNKRDPSRCTHISASLLHRHQCWSIRLLCWHQCRSYLDCIAGFDGGHVSALFKASNRASQSPQRSRHCVTYNPQPQQQRFHGRVLAVGEDQAQPRGGVLELRRVTSLLPQQTMHPCGRGTLVV
jgi:hypothetical protein